MPQSTKSAKKVFGREYQILIGKDNTIFVSSDVRITFKITKIANNFLNQAEIRVYNLKKSQVPKLNKFGESITLIAGYMGNIGIIFQGTLISYLSEGIEYGEGIDTFVQFLAQDGDLILNTPINKTFGAGYTDKTLVDTCVIRAKKNGLQGVFSAIDKELASHRHTRGRTLFATIKEIMNELGTKHKFCWHIDNAILKMYKKGAFSADGAGSILEFNELSLIGEVANTPQGLTFTTLLTPQAIIGGKVKLNTKFITQAQRSAYDIGFKVPKISHNGVYGVYRFEHIGDTHGNTWYTKYSCFNISDSRFGLKL